MLSQTQIVEAARQLDAAERKRSQIKPLTLSFPDMDMGDAYAIQQAWMDLKKARGASVAGYKIGLTSRAMQQAMNIDTPDYGVLLNDMRIANGSTVDARAYLDPRIEAEFAFVMKSPLRGDQVSLDQVLDATDYVVPSLELISARSARTDPDTGYTRTVFDTIADNAANAGFIPGDCRIDPRETDLRWSGALVSLNGVIEETGLGAAVMNHPAHGVQWVCRRFAAHGVGLEPNHFVLAGSFTRPIAVTPGDHIHADYGPFGCIDVHFAA
jgi:2-oxo-hept-3-ene-1,7-dioate hydratase